MKKNLVTFRDAMESSDEEDEGEEADVGGTVSKTKHDLMLKSEVNKQTQLLLS